LIQVGEDELVGKICAKKGGKTKKRKSYLE